MTIEEIAERLKTELIILSDCSYPTADWHSHDFFEFVYVLKGKAEHTIDDRTMILSEGDYFLIDLNSAHEYRKLGSEPDFCIVNCMFIPRFIDETLTDAKCFYDIIDFCLPDQYDQSASAMATLSSYHDNDGYIGALVLQMKRELQEKNAGYFEVLRNSLVNMLIALARNKASRTPTGTSQITKRITETVAKSYMRPLHLSDICKELNFSLTYVSLVFKRETNMSFRDYLIKIRLEKACHLLRLTDKSVAEIANLVGYSDPAFFYKLFKNELRLTPFQYRKFHRDRQKQ